MKLKLRTIRNADRRRVKLKMFGGCLSGLASASLAGTAFASNGTWLSTAATTDWGTSTNWAAGVIPGSQTPSATLTDAANFINESTGQTTVLPDLNRTIGNISITATTTDFTFGTAISGNTLFLSGNGAGNATWTNTTTGGLVQTFAGPMTLESAFQFVNSTTSPTDTYLISGTVNSAIASTLFLKGANTGNNIDAGTISDGAGPIKTSVAKNNAGFWAITGTNTYTGSTTLGAGTLALNGGTLSVALLANGGSPSAIGASTNSSSNLIFSGGTLQYTGPTVSTDRSFSMAVSGGGIDAEGTGSLSISGNMAVSGNLNGNGAIVGPTFTLTSNTASGNNTFGGKLIDFSLLNGLLTSVVKAGSGTWVFTGTNTYTGATLIRAGTLALSASTNTANVLAGGGSISTGTSATTPVAGGLLQLNYTGSGNANLVAKTTSLYLYGTTGTAGTIGTDGSDDLASSNAVAAVNTTFTNPSAVQAFANIYLDGQQLPAGLYSHANGFTPFSGSNPFTSDQNTALEDYFTGSGIVSVPEPASGSVIALVACSVLRRRRRRAIASAAL